MKKICILNIIFLIMLEIQLLAGGILNFVEGDVQIQKKGSGWAHAYLNMKIENGDVIKTFLASSAIVKLDDGSVLKIVENSVVTVSGTTASPDLKINFGGVRANVMKKINQGSSFTIITPVAVAGVRGTDFEVADGFDGSKFLVIDGTVEIEAYGKNTILNKSEKIAVSKRGTISKKETAKEGETLLPISLKTDMQMFEEQKKLKEEEESRLDAGSVSPDIQTSSIEALQNFEQEQYGKLPSPRINFPAANSVINRGAEASINITSSNILEWTNKKQVEIAGTAVFAKQVIIPDISGEWRNNEGEGIEGEITVTIIVENESLEYFGRTNSAGIFRINSITLKLPDNLFSVKLNNDELPGSSSNIKYSWILEQGENTLDISAEEKSANIKVRIKGSRNGIESGENQYVYYLAGRKKVDRKIQKLDSFAPEIDVVSVVTDNIVTLKIRDSEPTSGVYKVESNNISFKRVEGNEKDSYQVWEARLNIIRPDLPPAPPGHKKNMTIYQNITVKASDRAENVSTKTVNLEIR
ncbi:FecR domain-containing protein [Candidatus Dependentiae bacterium]|nr:FecR domain-containing protein [Candidatus Dependentiae bacterium]